MFRRIYIHNFRCLENFELSMGNQHSTLLIGKNGTGKSTVSFALALLQAIARGTNRVGQLVKPKDFFLGRTDAPMRFEVDVELDNSLYQYRLVLEFPSGFKELRVNSEQLIAAGQTVYSREHSKVSVVRTGREAPAEFMIDWHMIALPIIQEQSEIDPVFVFKRWLARSIILAPIPSLMTGESVGETVEPARDAQNFGSWFTGLLAHSPASYAVIDQYLKDGVIEDFWDIKNPMIAGESRSLTVQFRRDASRVQLPFAALSDGEKCFFLCALVIAANKAYGPVFCFWDEPDGHLSLDEVGHFVTTLRRAFEHGGQFMMASHNPEAIRRFSDENTLLLFRRGHLEPTRVKSLEEIGTSGDRIEGIIRGDISI